jgi:hypothetical protein
MQMIATTGTPMKAIIDGKTFDTATATALAFHEYVGVENDEKPKDVLYVSRRGAFFEWSNVDADDIYGTRKGPESIRPLTVDEALQWVEKRDVVLTDDYTRYLGELPPEAGSEEVAMTVRLTLALKTKIEKRARTVQKPMNSFVVDVLEKAVE